MSLSFPYQILDTFKVENNRILFRDLHLERIRKTTEFLKIQYGILIDSDLEEKVQKQFQKFEINNQAASKVRLVIQLNPFQIEVTSDPIVDKFLQIRLKFCQTGQQKSGIGIGNFKTTDRKYWDLNTHLILSPNDDVIGINDKGEVTETSRFSIFVQDGVFLYTPPLESGCLAGVYREYVLRQKYIDLKGQRLGVTEKELSKKDITENPIYVGNSVRGLLPAEIVEG